MLEDKSNKDLLNEVEQLQTKLEKLTVKFNSIKDYADCALWEYDIATKSLIINKKFKGRFEANDRFLENYQVWMHKHNIVHPDDWGVFDSYCNAMDSGVKNFSFEYRQTVDRAEYSWVRNVGETVFSKEGQPIYCIGKTIDISQEKRNNELLQHKALRDSLSDLYNKEATFNMINRFFENPDSKAIGGSFILIDIDNFKSINDNWGHLYGDEIIKIVSESINQASGTDDIIGRLGGDEFCVFGKGRNSEKAVHAFCQSLFSEIGQHRLKSGNSLSLSLGISFYPNDTESAKDLYLYSDIAMYTVKRNGKNNYAFYDESMKDGTITITQKPSSDSVKCTNIGYTEDYSHNIANRNIEEIKSNNVPAIGCKHYDEKAIRKLFHDSMTFSNSTFYVINRNTFKIMYADPGITKFFHGLKHGSLCHELLFGKDCQCEDCPLKYLRERPFLKSHSMIYKDQEGRVLSINIKPFESYDDYAIFITDITSYSKPLRELDSNTGALSFNTFKNKTAEALKTYSKYMFAVIGICNFQDVLSVYGKYDTDAIIRAVYDAFGKVISPKVLKCRVSDDQMLYLFDLDNELITSEYLGQILLALNASLTEKYHKGVLVRCYVSTFVCNHRLYGFPAEILEKTLAVRKDAEANIATDDHYVHEEIYN